MHASVFFLKMMHYIILPPFTVVGGLVNRKIQHKNQLLHVVIVFGNTLHMQCRLIG